MAELNESLVLDIICRLPLKYATQCSCLNKAIYGYISSPIFARQHALLSSSQNRYTTIFRYSEFSKNFTKVNTKLNSTSISTNMPNDAIVLILSSCGGLFLLLVRRYNLLGKKRYYVFNPTTGGVKFLDYSIYQHQDAALAVEIGADSGDFKLVMLDINVGVLRFTLVVPSANNTSPTSTMVTDFICYSFTRMVHRNMRPVYAHGCLHWLGECGTKIAAFDVENKRARMISGPLNKQQSIKYRAECGDPWFGFARGSLQFVYSSLEEIAVHAHDYDKDEWRFVHKIGNICNPMNNDIGNGVPVFFDGRYLFLYMRKKGEDGEIQMHDLVSGGWEKIDQVEGWDYWNQLFVAFVPTLAIVSNEYDLQEMIKYPQYHYKDVFLALQQFLRHC